jgi:hypothetical protein
MRAGERSGLLTPHRGDGNRFGVRSDEKLTAFIEPEALNAGELSSCVIKIERLIRNYP